LQLCLCTILLPSVETFRSADHTAGICWARRYTSNYAGSYYYLQTNTLQSWNVYNPANIARVKADEEAAAAREAAREQRMQELDAERRAAILRGLTPPPLPEEETKRDGAQKHDRGGDERRHDRKRRKLAGEDDTDMDIRLAANITKPSDGEDMGRILKLRTTASDAPLTDHAGNIDLFPVDMKEAIKREKNAEAEKEKRKKEKALEDQYTMRFSNAAGKPGLDQPWYAARSKSTEKDDLDYPGLENKNVWGNEDPLRKERERARISTNDPFAFMQKAQVQLQRSKADKKKWADERNRDLLELKATQEREDRRRKHRQRDGDDERERPSKSRCRSRSRSRDRERSHRSSNGRERDRARSRSRSRSPRRERDRKHEHERKDRHTRRSSRRRKSESPYDRSRRKEGARESYGSRR
jgi:hypothetical protein